MSGKRVKCDRCQGTGSVMAPTYTGQRVETADGPTVKAGVVRHLGTCPVCHGDGNLRECKVKRMPLGVWL